MEEAAENLGCTGFRKFRRITLPLIMPGLFAGGTIVFIFSFTELGVPLIFDYPRVTSVQIFYSIKEISGNPFPFALVVVMLFSTVLLYLVSKLLFGRTSHAMMAKATVAGGSHVARGMKGWLCAGFFAAVTALALLPHLGVIFVSFSGEWYRTVLPGSWTIEHYHTALGHYLTVPAIINSLKYASAATLVDVLLGIAIAYIVVRTELPGRAALDALAMLPLAVPGLVLAFGYLSMTQEGKFFASLSPTRDPMLLLIVAYSVRRLPYVVRSAVAGLQQTSVTLEEAAQNLGCPPLRTLRRITLPLIAANVIAGGLLAFSFAMLEVSDSLILAQKQEDYPITKAIYELFQLLGEGRFVASALGVWAMVFLAITIFAASRILGRRMGALFRV
jgi:iron(III) transport system permease protein